MNILLVLSFKGSCVLAGYYVLCLLLGKAFSHRLRKEYVYTLQNELGVQLIGTIAVVMNSSNRRREYMAMLFLYRL